MHYLLLFGLAGFAASLVDGALGMGFGPTSSSILLGSGLAPAAVSASVNLAKVATGAAAGVSHWRFRNIDRPLVLRLALPGCLGALAGVTVLSSVDATTLRPVLAALLALIGLRILLKFGGATSSLSSGAGDSQRAGMEPANRDENPTFNPSGVKVAALLGGMTNGMIGAWGPVVTPFLLHRGVPPRFAIGSVNTAEVAVAAVSAFSLIASLGHQGLDAAVVLAMLLGGVVAAPVAAWLIRSVPARLIGVAVAGLLLLTNARELAAWTGIASAGWMWFIYSAILASVALALAAPRLRTLVGA